MNPTKHLSTLVILSHRRTGHLRERVTDLSLKSSSEIDLALTATTIDAAGLWSSFLRAYYFSIFGNARTTSGGRLSFGMPFVTLDDALRFAITKYGKPAPKGQLTRRNDPAWHHLTSYYALLRDAGASNLQTVTAAFGYQTLYFDYLTTTRNFYAHRCEDTFNKAARLGIELGISSRLNLHPNITLSTRAANSSCEVITDWLYDMDMVIDALCS